MAIPYFGTAQPLRQPPALDILRDAALSPETTRPIPLEDMARVWPIIVQFGVGAILCAIGVSCGIASGYLDLKNAEDKRVVFIVIVGFVGLLVLSSIFTFWLPNIGNAGVVQ